jgi:hypothetical protein
MELSTLRDFEADTRTLVPKFSVKWKNESLVQKILGVLLFFNPKYMTGYVTTFYPTVYYSSQEKYESNPADSLIVVAHERVHLLDTAKHRWWFKFSYLLPQVLFAPFIVISIICLLCHLNLVGLVLLVLGLVALAPWPSPWRTQWEKRGYAMTFAVNYWLFGVIPDQLKQSVRGHFFDWSYYKMSRNPKDIDSWISSTVYYIQSGGICSDAVYFNVHRFLLSKGLIQQ